MNTLTAPDDRRAKRNVTVLVAAQAILGAQMPMIFTTAGLAGQSLAPNPCWATLPISAAVLGSMLSATPMSAFMQRRGRRAGFVLGSAAGCFGAIIAAFGLLNHSFWMFVIAALFTGVYMSAQGFYRFAATDTASDAFKPKAISYVMAGGLLSAIIGPQLVKVTSDAMVIPFLGTYFGVIAVNLVGVWLFAFLDIPMPQQVSRDAPIEGRSRGELLREPVIVVAIICATVSYALMNLVMTSTPLAVVGCGYQTSNAADIVSAHVLAMYAPSFFTGHLIARFGVEKIVALGLVILAGAGAVAMSGLDLQHFFVALILLGIGWNFGFIGGTTMLARAHTGVERGRIQGVNDAIVFGGVTVASISSGQLMNCSGSDVQTGWQMVNLAMLPFLVLAGGALIWLAMRPKAA
ncbi:MAG: MFS transporter [Rhodobacter sp.]|uniref:MFS transporter n=1 Tax=Pararhodobacter sp. TaxID=2127056 RepID=UPI001E14054E|nr:MFS transporter [Pararhodobacter sp.]MCB1344299.1 MFS transporter [Paracoccaceae bacterium]MCC0073382.1 MFS transporter [Rhodobacter sp.]HPD91158.1 MFS transporter [Pararhodobacter sp.]